MRCCRGVCRSRNVCNLRKGLGVYISGECASNGRAKGRRDGVAGRRGVQGLEREEEASNKLETGLQHACNYLATTEELRGCSGGESVLLWRQCPRDHGLRDECICTASSPVFICYSGHSPGRTMRCNLFQLRLRRD